MQAQTNEDGLLRLAKPARATRGAIADARRTWENALTETPRTRGRRFERYARRIRIASDIREAVDLFGDTLSRHAADELACARQRAAEAEHRIAVLESELHAVSKLLRIDPLTGALNRRGLAESFAREVARADRRGAALCLAVFDIDDFKQINDGYGHHIGDTALVQLVHLVQNARRSLRPQDVLTRLGGDEFVILLPDTSLDAAGAILARLHKDKAVTAKALAAGNRRVTVSLSAGLALRNPTESLASTLGRADRALYQAKRAGKNRTCLAA